MEDGFSYTDRIKEADTYLGAVRAFRMHRKGNFGHKRVSNEEASAEICATLFSQPGIILYFAVTTECKKSKLWDVLKRGATDRVSNTLNRLFSAAKKTLTFTGRLCSSIIM